MGTAERKEREKQERREAILDAAETVFFTKGRETATMDDVAEAAELSKGTLYLYFSGKEDLYLALNIRGLNIMSGMFARAVKSETSGLEKVVAIGRAYVEFSQKHSDYFKALLYYESKELDDDTAETSAIDCFDHGHQAQIILIKALEQGIRDGSIRPDIDPNLMAVTLWGMTTGMIQLAFTKGEHIQYKHQVDIDQVMDYAMDVMKYALENKATGE